MVTKFRILTIVLLIVVWPLSCFAGHKDYSSLGGEFVILKNIRLDVSKISFSEKRSVMVEGLPFDASVFSVKANVTIQTKESYVGNYSTFEDLDTEYELVVGFDVNNKLHDKLIDDIYQFWIVNPLDNSVVGDKNVTFRDSSQLIFSGKGYPNLVWFDGRFVKIQFKKFLNTKKSGLGAEQSLWDDKIRFYDGKKRVKLEYLENGLQAEFLRWYKAGKFKLPTQAIH